MVLIFCSPRLPLARTAAPQQNTAAAGTQRKFSAKTSQLVTLATMADDAVGLNGDLNAKAEAEVAAKSTGSAPLQERRSASIQNKRTSSIDHADPGACDNIGDLQRASRSLYDFVGATGTGLNLLRHPTLLRNRPEPLVGPNVSTRSRQVMREGYDLGFSHPGLRALYDVGCCCSSVRYYRAYNTSCSVKGLLLL